MIVPITPVLAYIGPGAGFAVIGSFLSLLGGILFGVVSALVWPVRMAARAITGKRGYRNAKVKKLIFLGLDGLDPTVTERYMAEGKLPNLSRLREQGGFHRLRTTFPALSPVAWSTFATGVSPARHAMFDFLNRDLRTYMPELASTRIHPPERVLKIAGRRIPLSRPLIEMRRKSRPFWQILGDHGIASTILRVPITFPPEKFSGRLLSAMCTPDLLGTQGTFSLHTTRASTEAMESGNRFPLVERKGAWHGEIVGPGNWVRDNAGAVRIPFTLTLHGGGKASLLIAGQRYPLTQGEYTDWLTLTFRAAMGANIRGIARFLLTETEGAVSLYSTPINLDPEAPALPISHPGCYATYLAKLLGAFSTLGMAEDTWALNEQAIDADAFLKQAWLIYEEREAMFFSALDRTRRGVVACVFDTTDRVQHMFFGKDEGTIETLYRRADDLVGKTLKHVDPDTALFVLSDHGFATFDRGCDLNAWLLQNGYLALRESAGGEKYLKDVDWSRTQAYAIGLAGLYINKKGREAQGIVDPDAAPTLEEELAAKLTGLRDPDRDRIAIRKAWPSRSLYTGPYLHAAPDVIPGYADGYRVSWDAAVGKVNAQVFEDNHKHWAADHCVDPRLVPGVLFSNRRILAEDPGIEDLAPTALDLFGIEPPPYIEGTSLFRKRAQPTASEAAA
jgi:predicted AlkP superfamily phosphohydrolase/phosphomutase